MSKNRTLRLCAIIAMAFLLIFQNAQGWGRITSDLFVMSAFAEEDIDEENYDEEEYIPDEYYEPIQSNDTEGWPEGQAIQAAAGVVMDMDTGAFLYSKNEDRQLYPASITKIMTALLVLENCNLDDVMTCSSVVYELDDNASNTGLQEGEQMTVRDALYTLMLESANDTANALAEYTAGSIDAFAQMMNDKAAALGCTGTHFANPSGLSDDNHYTTAHDMALIANAAYANETFRTLVSTVESEVDPTNLYEETRYLSNHHQMLHTDSEYYKEWCTGGKTGYTEAAWNTLVTYGEKDGKRLVCVLLHGNGAAQNYLETIDLMNYGFDNFEHVNCGTSFRSGTLADVMNMRYLGRAQALQAEELSQTAAAFTGTALVTVPAGTGTSGVTAKSSAVGSGNFDFLYNGRKVGSMGVTVNPVTLSLTIPWQTKATVTVEGTASGDKESEVSQTNQEVWQSVSDFVLGTEAKISAWLQRNKTAVILTFGVIIIVLLLMLLIMLLRSTSEYRSKKKRRQAAREAERLSEEIEAKSAIEIEEELRAAMNAEDEKRQFEEDMDDILHDEELDD